MTPRIGSLFSGYGGLDMGVQAVLGGEVAWYSDVCRVTKDAVGHHDPHRAPCSIMAHHHPDVPNLGDIATVDWTQVEPVDVITGGFPCQDVSHAGKRAGLRPDTRSGLWSQMAYAIDQLRPRLVVAENVRGLLSADAASELEPCPWCVGDGEDGVLRALGAVLGDLADIGYDARWVGLPASAVGAPHGRFRVFITAWPAADATGDTGWVSDGDSRASADSGGERHGGGQDSRRLGRLDSGTEGQARQRERARRVPGDRGAQAASHTDSRGPQGVGRLEPVGRDTDGRGGADVAWGVYEPAIRRWESVLGRVAPAPTETSPKGGQRLSPRFVEWMQGLDPGWVTDVPGLTRNAQLKALGNGVVPRQAAAALTSLLWAPSRAVA